MEVSGPCRNAGAFFVAGSLKTGTPNPQTVIEVLAAATGASITMAAMGWGSNHKRNAEGRDAVVRLTAAVESVASRLDELHVDLRADRRETFTRLNDVEQRVAKLEARQ